MYYIASMALKDWSFVTEKHQQFFLLSLLFDLILVQDWPFLGLFAVLMRDLANASGDGPKWIVLDGDIDPMWIESLNTVMDDNKVRKCLRFAQSKNFSETLADLLE